MLDTDQLAKVLGIGAVGIALLFAVFVIATAVRLVYLIWSI